jgi:hypothetical protein
MNASVAASSDTQSRAVKHRNRLNLRTNTRPVSPIERAIANASNNVCNQITGDPLTEFSIDGPNEIGFIGVDSIAELLIAGSYEYNVQRVVIDYGFKAFADEIGLPDLFVWADPGGGAGDFGLHTTILEVSVNAKPDDFAAAWASGNSQYLANWFDAMAGGNHYDPLSTAVAIWGKNDFFWA